MSQIAAVAQHSTPIAASPIAAHVAAPPPPGQRPAFVVSIASLAASRTQQAGQGASSQADNAEADSDASSERAVNGIDVTA